MNPATINATTFTVTGPEAMPVTGTVTYAATITTGARDPADAPLTANIVWTFTTAPPATVISMIPVNGASATTVNTAVSATFSEAMNPATITAATFALTGPGATSVAGVVTYSGTIATFTPSALLATGTLFTATITTGAKDPGGAASAANFEWTFTTVVPPTVVSTVPANGASGVPVNTPISGTFSHAMDPTTITAATFTVLGPGATPVSGTLTYAGIAPAGVTFSTAGNAAITTLNGRAIGLNAAVTMVNTVINVPAP
jgi:hypothetical protein